MNYKCTAKCPELDIDNAPHCHCFDLNFEYEMYPDGCPCGNIPIWEPIEKEAEDE